jgi:hypothetical protein
MTRRDYINIADILNQYAVCERDNIPFSMDDIIASFASMLAEDNERFDKEIFYQRTYRS